MALDMLDGLRVQNELFKLGLSEKDFAEIEAEALSFGNEAKDDGRSARYAFRQAGKYSIEAVHSPWSGDSPKGLSVRLTDDKPAIPSYAFSNVRLNFPLQAGEIRFAAQVVARFWGIPREVFSKEELRLSLIREMRQDTRVSMSDLRSLFWLFDREWDSEAFPRREDACVDKIVAVLETRNWRLYAVEEPDGRAGEERFKLRKAVPDHDVYNHIDEGRLFHKDVFFRELSEDEIDPDLAEQISRSLRSGQGSVVVGRPEYEQYRQRFSLAAQRERREREARDRHSEALDRRIKEFRAGKPLTVNGIRFTCEAVTYGGQTLSSPQVPVPEMIKWVSLDSRLAFDTVCDRFVKCLVSEHPPFEAILGSLKVGVRGEQRKNSRGVSSTQTNVNGIRINRKELEPVLREVRRFERMALFEAFLKEVSRCSLKTQRFIQNGALIPFRCDVSGREKCLRFRVARLDRRNFLVVGDRKLGIRDTDQLIVRTTLNPGRRCSQGFHELLDFLKRFFGLDAEGLIHLFKTGIKTYEEAETRSRALLQEAIRTFNVREISAEVDGSQRAGFLIRGKARIYFLTRDLKVYDWPSKRYICIVDNSRNAVVGADHLVNRIYALANDRLVARNIHTLRV